MDDLDPPDRRLREARCPGGNRHGLSVIDHAELWVTMPLLQVSRLRVCRRDRSCDRWPLGACTCLVCISAGGWFEHGSNVCPGVCRVSRWVQVGDLRRWRSACPGAPFSCGTRGRARSTNLALTAEPALQPHGSTATSTVRDIPLAPPATPGAAVHSSRRSFASGTVSWMIFLPVAACRARRVHGRVLPLGQ
jgi:hypothetical protein